MELPVSSSAAAKIKKEIKYIVIVFILVIVHNKKTNATT
jgi:hypothetical protein